MNLLKMKSRGLIVVLIFTLLVSGLVWWGGNAILKANFKNPIFTQFIDSIPTIAIDDETVISPADTNTVRYLADTPFLFIQTDRDYVGVGVVQDGIYLTKKAVTVLANGNIISQVELPDEAVITPEKLHRYFGYIITWVPVLLALIYMGILWLFYLTLVGFSSLIGLLIKKNGQMPSHSAWRCSMMAMLIVLIIDFTAGYFGYSLLPTMAIYGFSVPLFQWISALILAVVLMSIETFVGAKDLVKEEKKTKKIK
ncbi:MAG: hypothetical protein E7021_04840 [Alphaproteobacteria bacterium]|nr:hypothetical protein [Alphaproteobacteria bacterium]